MFLIPLISPLEARDDKSYFVVILLGSIIVAIFIGISILLSILKKRKIQKKNDPNRKTTKEDIEIVSKKMQLNETDKDFLAYLCKKNNVPNLSVTIKDNAKVYKIFKDEFENFTNYDEMMKAVFFELRNKIEFYYNIENTISSTKQIEQYLNVAFIHNNDRYLGSVEKIAEDGVYIAQPLNIAGEPLEVKNLTRVMMLFSSPSNFLGYKVMVRILRTVTIDDKNFIIIAHTNNIQVIHRRHTGRINFDKDVMFKAVIASEDKKTGEKKYKILDKLHKGRFSDISPNGCAIITKLPIRPKQYIYLDFMFDENTPAKVIGLIVGVEFNKYTEYYSLHIKFEKNDLKLSNKINSMYMF